MRMMKTLRFLIAGSVLPASLATGAATHRPAAPVDLRAYPKLDRNQLGHVRYLVAMADQLDGDWAGMSTQGTSPGFDGYRYQLAFATYTLGLAFNEYTPAYPELYRQASDRLINKMLREDVWGDWYQTSKGVKPLFDPDLTELGPGWYDPVVKKNIMYSGHLLQMINMYEQLYGDRKWEKPDSIVFRASTNFGPEIFKYNNQTLAGAIYRQFEENGWTGVECEPNATFPECNQHPILGFKHYDWLHGTKLFASAAPEFKAAFLRLNYVDPKTGSFMFFNQLKQKKIIYEARPWSDGWSGMWMHAWDPAYVQSIYPIQRDRHLVKLGNSLATVPLAQQRPNWYNFDFGFFVAYAAEMGDRRTRDALLHYADRYMSPTWLNGGLYYPRHDEYYANEAERKQNIFRRMGPMGGNVLLGMARLNPGGGLHRLYDRPQSLSSAPYVEGFRYPGTLVTRARFDAAKKAMIVSLMPGRDKAVRTSWKVHRLDGAATWRVWMDGRQMAALGPSATRSGSFSRKGDTLSVDMNLARPVDIVVQMN